MFCGWLLFCFIFKCPLLTFVLCVCSAMIPCLLSEGATYPVWDSVSQTEGCNLPAHKRFWKSLGSSFQLFSCEQRVWYSVLWDGAVNVNIYSPQWLIFAAHMTPLLPLKKLNCCRWRLREGRWAEGRGTQPKGFWSNDLSYYLKNTNPVFVWLFYILITNSKQGHFNWSWLEKKNACLFCLLCPLSPFHCSFDSTCRF